LGSELFRAPHPDFLKGSRRACSQDSPSPPSARPQQLESQSGRVVTVFLGWRVPCFIHRMRMQPSVFLRFPALGTPGRHSSPTLFEPLLRTSCFEHDRQHPPAEGYADAFSAVGEEAGLLFSKGPLVLLRLLSGLLAVSTTALYIWQGVGPTFPTISHCDNFSMRSTILLSSFSFRSLPLGAFIRGFYIHNLPPPVFVVFRPCSRSSFFLPRRWI